MMQIWPPEPAEIAAIMEAVEEEAKSFLTACVHFARYMEDDVEPGLAIDLLKGMTEETYARLEYYRGRIHEITGRLADQTGTPPPAARMHGPPKEGGYYGGIQI